MPNQTAVELRRLIDNMLALGQKPTRALRKRYRRARRLRDRMKADRA